MNRKILSLAIPSIISNITVPLLGLVDVTIVGHLGTTAYIGAIAVGGMLFSMLYWVFGFLRMGTSGLTSQAFGRQDEGEQARVLFRALSAGVLLAACILALQGPVSRVAFELIGAPAEVERAARVYFNIRVWGAPAVLGMYGFTGWFVGMQNSRYPMWIALGMNVVNIGCSLGFVYGLGMEVEGVALGTVVAEWSAIVLAVLLWRRRYGHLRGRARWRECLQMGQMKRFFAVNRDIFLRTLCLVAVTVFFTSTGARQGEVVLAVNTLLMQLFTLFSYVMDGFAYAGDALVGRYIGARDGQGLRAATQGLFRWGVALAVVFTLVYAVGGEGFLGLLTNDATVVVASGEYLPWAVGIPLAGFAAFLWDGILVGATATRVMLASMAVAAGSFFAIYWWGGAATNNHVLWLGFLVYLLLRGALQGWWGRAIFHEK